MQAKTFRSSSGVCVCLSVCGCGASDRLPGRNARHAAAPPRQGLERRLAAAQRAADRCPGSAPRAPAYARCIGLQPVHGRREAGGFHTRCYSADTHAPRARRQLCEAAAAADVESLALRGIAMDETTSAVVARCLQNSRFVVHRAVCISDAPTEPRACACVCVCDCRALCELGLMQCGVTASMAAQLLAAARDVLATAPLRRTRVLLELPESACDQVGPAALE
jgi:hypothetical protein